MELKVLTEDGISRIISGVTEHTTCKDVIVALAQAIGCEGTYSMVLLWENGSQVLSPNERPVNIVKSFAESGVSVRFLVKHNSRNRGKVISKAPNANNKVKTPVLNIDKPIQQKQHRLKKAHTFNAPSSTKSFMNYKYEATRSNERQIENFNVDQSNVKFLASKKTAQDVEPNFKSNHPTVEANSIFKKQEQQSPSVPLPRTSLLYDNQSNMTQYVNDHHQNNFQHKKNNFDTKHLTRSDMSAFKPLVANKNLLKLQQNNLHPVDHNNNSSSNIIKKSKPTGTDLLKIKLHQKMFELQQQQEQIELLNKEISNMTTENEDSHRDELKMCKLTILEQKLETEIDELEIVSWREKLEQENEKMELLGAHEADITEGMNTITMEISKLNSAIEEVVKDVKYEEEMSKFIEQETEKMKKTGDEQLEELKSELQQITKELNTYNEHINGQLIDISQKQNLLNS